MLLKLLELDKTMTYIPAFCCSILITSNVIVNAFSITHPSYAIFYNYNVFFIPMTLVLGKSCQCRISATLFYNLIA